MTSEVGHIGEASWRRQHLKGGKGVCWYVCSSHDYLFLYSRPPLPVAELLYHMVSGPPKAPGQRPDACNRVGPAGVS